MEFVCREWKGEQGRTMNSIAKINPFTVSFIAEMADEFGFEDSKENKVVKLEFFFILAVNYK